MNNICHEGYAKHPCAQHVYSQGFAIRPIRLYPYGRIRIEGVPRICKNIDLSVSSI